MLHRLASQWETSAEFMTARRGRLGMIRRALGMSFEVIVGLAAGRAGKELTDYRQVRSIFVLRNNDLGDVLCSTPLFAALRGAFPMARVAAGVGQWAEPIVRHNPFVDEVVPIDAPWFNKFVPDRSLGAATRYVFGSRQASDLARKRYDLGIDVLGSHFGAALLLRAGVPKRIGVSGYAGGHSAWTRSINYDPTEHVARAAVRLAEVLGAIKLPAPLPQLYLTPNETAAGVAFWPTQAATNIRRLVVGAGGGGVDKHWPPTHYLEMVRLLAANPRIHILLVGSQGDAAVGAALAAANPQAINFCGRLSLRETFAAVAAADAVACNSSMLLHAAAAFGRPNAVLLGPGFYDPDQHFRQWCYAGLSTYPPGTGRLSIPTPLAAASTVLRLLGLTPSFAPGSP